MQPGRGGGGGPVTVGPQSRLVSGESGFLPGAAGKPRLSSYGISCMFLVKLGKQSNSTS